MKTTPRTEADAVRVAQRTLLPDGWMDAEIREVSDHISKRGNETIAALVVVRDVDGNERELTDYLTDVTLGAAKLRHACAAVNALDRYNAGSIGPFDFAGKVCRVLIGVEKRKGYAPRNIIVDYAAAAAGRVVNLRDAG